MRVAVVLVVAGVALIVWIKHSRHTADPPAWKPADRGITNNRTRR